MTRHLSIIGEINWDAYKEFSEGLRELEANNSDRAITVELTSEGGSAYAALAFYSRIQSSQCHIVIKANGYIASAAVLILAAGDTRIMAAEAWVMVHEDAPETSGEVWELEREVAQYRRLEDQWDKLLEHCTKTDAAAWKQFHKQTTYFSAAECKKLGLVDRVV